MMASVDSKTIADAMGVTDRAIRDRALRESWPYTEESCRGGRRRRYALAALPADVRERVERHLLAQQAAAMQCEALTPNPSPKGRGVEALTPSPSPAGRGAEAAPWHAAMEQLASRPARVREEAVRRARACLAVKRLVDSGLSAR